MSQRHRESSDEELVAQCKRGSARSFRELVRRYQGRVYQLALRLTRNEQDAQEVLQDAFFSAYRKLETFRGESSFATWMYRITANAGLMKVRSRSPRQDLSFEEQIAAIEEQPSQVGAWPDDLEQLILQREELAALSRAVDLLPEKYRLVFWLREIEGLSVQDVAEALGVSQPNVKTRLHRARLFLREELDKLFAKEKNTAQIESHE